MQNEANLGQSQIFIIQVSIVAYSENMELDTWSKQTQSKPNKAKYLAPQFIVGFSFPFSRRRYGDAYLARRFTLGLPATAT